MGHANPIFYPYYMFGKGRNKCSSTTLTSLSPHYSRLIIFPSFLWTAIKYNNKHNFKLLLYKRDFFYTWADYYIWIAEYVSDLKEKVFNMTASQKTLVSQKYKEKIPAPLNTVS